ncbi:hypothetical protein GCM10010343_13640 [Streptomyces avidinii]|uniref:Uncharacterized protein n=1 Tax=Streptomyces avidinii TaxID=1895 RepID=A0ABS4KXW6_STRAV|nr:hypothetical protein [Streptomyces avidinii]MBP2034885.1 hypothetical protein [Streptomyces avidinii]GGY89640.1 hypothetical protein GCM10010343_13640 [Streptomyces avidinii]
MERCAGVGLCKHPYRFDPHRFTGPDDADNPLAGLIPQGGGDAPSVTAAPERTSP